MGHTTDVQRVAAPAAVGLVAWLAGLAVTLAVAVVAGSAPGLGAPPLGDVGSLAPWLAGRDPVVAALAIARMAVVAVAGYLLAVTVLGVVARVLRARRLVDLVDAVTVPGVRRLVQGALGVGLLGATVVPAGGVAVAAAPPATAQEQPVAGEEGSGPAVAPGPPTLRRLEEPVAPPPGDAGREVTLQPGDHLWSVAEDALTAAWGRAPTTPELAPYWAGLVEANRPRLPDPANPDLVFPGDTVVVPAPPPVP